ncbi:VOC family protein [Gordonia sp. TBRC 11910]|uniref:VOC family protein n=1 Tax=Gordonia asplenii TaxID=2725283 RepID=A0A848KQ80_9ACTN|nr:VOC family protein [Gordonia asplenii]NMO00189.1 VOC family protein [Gordonia asplenii]
MILRPVDYATTLAFYRDTLGLAISREYPGGTVFFAGQTLIEVAGHHADDAGSGFSGAIWLQVRDVAAVEAGVRAADVEIVRAAQTEPWGLVEMWIADPDGVPIVFVEVPPNHPLRRDLR